MENNRGNTSKGLKLFILLLLVIAIFLFNKNNHTKILDFINSFKIGGKTLVLTNSFDNDNIIDMNFYNETIVTWNDNKISFMKVDGEIILEKEFNFTEPAIYYGEKYIYPFDKSTGDIYFLSKNGETVDRLQLGKEVFNIKEIKEHLLCHSKIENIEKIDILDKDSILVGNPSFKDKSILSYDINKKGSKILVSLLDLNDNILKSEVNFYGEDNEMLDSLIIEGEIVLFNELIKDDTKVILTDKTLYYIKNKEIIWEKSFNIIKDIYIIKDIIYILHSNYLEAINLKGDIINKIGFTKDYNNIIDFNGGTLVYGDEDLAVVNNGKLIIEHEEAILKICTNGSEIIILGPNTLNIFKLTNK